MGLCLNAAGKLTVTEQRAMKDSNFWPSTEEVSEPLVPDAFASPSSPRGL